MVIEELLKRDASVCTVADADRAGARIATGTTSAYTLVLRARAEERGAGLPDGE
jgi:hypothetical protein